MDKIGGTLNLKEYNGLCRSGEGSENLREFQKTIWGKISVKKIL
jgi:hypothetical protein